MPNYPTSLDTLSNPASGTDLADPILKHSLQHATLNDIVEAIEAKLGIGAGGPGATDGVLRRLSTGSSGWGLVQAADLGAGLGSAVSLLLDYKEATDLYANSTWAGGTSIPFSGAKAFTVAAATSLVEVIVRVGLYNGTSPPANTSETQSFIVIDGTTRYNLGSTGSNGTGNPFAGAQPVYITGLSAGSHTVQVYVMGSSTTAGWYCRCASNPNTEHFTLQVVEHKQGVGIQGVQGVPGNMTNPMTAVDDIIVGSTAGAPIRRAKGANSRVFGVDASGVLGYRQVDGPDIVAQSIKGASVGAGMHIGYQTIYGSQAGGNSNIYPGSIQGGDLANNTITAANIANNTITAANIAAGAISQFAVGPTFSQLMGVTTPWAWMSGSAQVGLSFTGGYGIGFMWGTAQCNGGLGSVAYIGLAIDSTTTANVSVTSQGNPGCTVPFCLVLPMGNLSGAHTIYGTGGTPSGTCNFSGQMFILELKK